MKKKFLIVLVIIFCASIAAAVPAVPNCSEVEAKVLKVEVARETPFRQLTVKIKIDEMSPCSELPSSLKESRKVIDVAVFVLDLKSPQLTEGDVISGKVKYRGDGRQGGYRLEDVKILSSKPKKPKSK